LRGAAGGPWDGGGDGAGEHSKAAGIHVRMREAFRHVTVPAVSSAGRDVRLYDLLPNGPVILDVAEERDFGVDLPVEEVIRIGPGGYVDSTGLIRGLLGRKDGWILVRPDAHVAWARVHLDGTGDALWPALGATRSPAMAGRR
jgi:hypothetical protein